MVDVVYTALTDKERDRITAALRKADQWQVKSQDIPLPPAILAAQSGWAARVCGAPHAPFITVIRNMPTVGEEECGMLSRWMGFRSKRSSFSRISSNRTYGSGVVYEPPLPWHTDSSQTPHPPEYAALACQRGSSEAVTSFVPVRNILQRLDTETIRQLEEPHYSHGEAPAANAARPW